MIKKIPISELRPNMFVSDLNCDWIPHGPKNKQGKIPGDELIQQIIALGIKEVYIDTEKGLDVKYAETLADVENLNQEKLEKASELAPIGKEVVSIHDEFHRATKIHLEATRLVDNVLNSVKMGNSIEIETVNQLSSDLIDSVFRNKDALTCLGRIRNKDSYLLEHSVNLSVLMAAFGRDSQFTKQILKEISIGALLHDIGKIMVPDEILHKPGKLNQSEFLAIKQHVIHSKELLMNTPGISNISIMVAGQHHEKMDGSGYPDGLIGEQISLYGRMCAIVDVYDALTADRCYHDCITPTQALKKMLEWTDHHLDKNLVHQFIKCVGIYPVGSLVKLDSNKLGIVLQQGKNNQKEPLVRVFYNIKQKCYIKIKDIDLSKSSVQDFIVGTEDPRSFGIEVKDFLNPNH